MAAGLAARKVDGRADLKVAATVLSKADDLDVSTVGVKAVRTAESTVEK